MKFELLVVAITAFFIINTYYDGKYSKLLLSWKKYYKMAFFGFMGFTLYLLLKRNPGQGKTMLLHANNMIKYMPIDSGSLSMLNPILDFTVGKDITGFTDPMETPTFSPPSPQEVKGMMHRGGRPTKRSVSETKKKYVASIQDWKCGHCSHKLTHTFEIDHKIRLEHGGGNDPSNFVALCRECHGQKTASENM